MPSWTSQSRAALSKLCAPPAPGCGAKGSDGLRAQTSGDALPGHACCAGCPAACPRRAAGLLGPPQGCSRFTAAEMCFRFPHCDVSLVVSAQLLCFAEIHIYLYISKYILYPLRVYIY